jgi:hypothetical protein
MADCEYLDECALFERIRNRDIKRFWIDVCCTAPRQETCARKTLLEAGQPVPEALLPNGATVDPLDTVILPPLEEAVKAAGCEYWEECFRTLFATLQYDSLRAFWTNLFCSGPKREQCARKLLLREGKQVPNTLLPNGKGADPQETVTVFQPQGD